jgi:hypothetical protein
MRTRQRRLLGMVAAGLVVAGAGCGSGNDDGAQATAPPGVDGGQSDDGGEDGGGGDQGDAGDGSEADDLGACEDIGSDVLDQFLPGLELVDTEPVGNTELTELECNWETGDGSNILFLMVYDGVDFYGESLYDEADITRVDLCDQAFVTEDFGLSLQVLDGERVVSLGSTQAGVPDDERMSREEGIDRLTAVGQALTGC